MGGLVLLSSIVVGLTVVLSSWLYPNNIVSWFMSSDATMIWLRSAVLTGLLLLVVIRAHYQNALTRTSWAVVSVVLAWWGFEYFLDNPQFLLDVLYVWAASISFAITAIQQSDEPVGVAWILEIVLPAIMLVRHSKAWRPAERLAYRKFLVDVGHRLVVDARRSQSNTKVLKTVSVN